MVRSWSYHPLYAGDGIGGPIEIREVSGVGALALLRDVRAPVPGSVVANGPRLDLVVLQAPYCPRALAAADLLRLFPTSTRWIVPKEITAAFLRTGDPIGRVWGAQRLVAPS